MADVFDALARRRPYKDAWPVGAAVREILGETGTKFDPRVIEAFAGLGHAALVQPARTLPGAVAAVEDEPKLGRGKGAGSGADVAAA